MRSPRRVSPRPRLRRIPDISEPLYVLHENLGELVDSVLNESITRARKLGRAMRDFVDHGASGRRAAGGDHARNCRRRGELSCQTLHKNCPNCRRLQTVGQTTDGFSFQTGSTAHVMRVCRRDGLEFRSAVQERTNGQNALGRFSRHNMRQSVQMATRHTVKGG